MMTIKNTKKAMDAVLASCINSVQRGGTVYNNEGHEWPDGVEFMTITEFTERMNGILLCAEYNMSKKNVAKLKSYYYRLLNQYLDAVQEAREEK